MKEQPHRRASPLSRDREYHHLITPRDVFLKRQMRENRRWGEDTRLERSLWIREMAFVGRSHVDRNTRASEDVGG